MFSQPGSAAARMGTVPAGRDVAGMPEEAALVRQGVCSR